ncbi:unnamed protein product [Fraxinus pennsylvanica]|uniref:Uncharacterized protein n=1 Tax=Fraxinus pennsylvanica TaxID=56036 RepID=A0AAD2ACF8_9LAMI|nr:unnamed protein product [Fraxinus pennsylvanica]
MSKAVVEPEEVDDGKVTILFGTQTGTTEGFAKIWKWRTYRLYNMVLLSDLQRKKRGEGTGLRILIMEYLALETDNLSILTSSVRGGGGVDGAVWICCGCGCVAVGVADGWVDLVWVWLWEAVWW